MDQKPSTAPVHGQNIGFQAPPAYDQYQNYPNQYQGPPLVYPPGQQPQVIHIITGSIFGPDPALITCPSCRQSITTHIEYEPSTKTHLMAGLMCLLFWPCFCLPYLMDACKDAKHSCPHCGAYLGTYRGS